MRRSTPGCSAPVRRIVVSLSAALALFAQASTVFAQLAITEVMSNGSTNGLGSGLQRPDFWELTNFGTNDVDLTGYRWGDADEKPLDARVPMPFTTILSRESIIFVRANESIPDVAAFRAWWGYRLPADLQIYSQHAILPPGFDADNGDAVRLWNPDGKLVDEVRFGSGLGGVTLTYDPNSGEFSRLSQADLGGAFSSAQGADVGSPGIAPLGAVPVRITQQPVNQRVDAGSEVILRVQATGRPAPRYQWYFNGAPIQSAEAPMLVPRLVHYANCGPAWLHPPGPNDLTLPRIRPEQSGDYFVEVFNGLTRQTSAVVTVAVNTNASPIQIECPPESLCDPGIGPDSITALIANPGQTGIFTVRTRGYPVPTFQWSSSVNGVTFTDLPGATNRDLTIEDITSAHATHYRVRMQNSSGTALGWARLSVEQRPQLEITEVMSLACTPSGQDWWELTNTGEKAVNLWGYRWDDGDFTYSIGGGPTITNNVVVQPGESVILMESQSPESFIRWWGATNLPPNLQFVTYSANGLGEDGDAIRLWPPNETDELRWVALAEFSKALFGVTRWWDLSRCANEFGTFSQSGHCGAFRAEQACEVEVGSPGWTRWTPPALTSVRREGSRSTLSWKAQPGSVNRLQFARELAVPMEATVWEDLGTFQFPQASCVATDASIGSDTQRFYRVVRIAAADCPCPGPDQ